MITHDTSIIKKGSQGTLLTTNFNIDYFKVSLSSSDENVVSTDVESTTIVESVSHESHGVVSVDCEHEANIATARIAKNRFFILFYKFLRLK